MSLIDRLDEHLFKQRLATGTRICTVVEQGLKTGSFSAVFNTFSIYPQNRSDKPQQRERED
jgi:hypothetical protein